MKQFKLSNTTLALLLFLVALLVNAWLCHRAAQGACHAHWIEWHQDKPSLWLLVPLAIVAARYFLRIARKCRLFASTARFLISNHLKKA